jgi:autotransporter-associated beta strand protein
LANTPTDVVLTFDGTNATATFTQGTNTFSTGPVPFNFAIGSTALLGFTGATGGLSGQQQISNFSFTTLSLPNFVNDVNVAAGSSTIGIAATAAAPSISFGALTMASGSTLNVVADSSTPTDQAYFLTFGATTLNGPATISVGNNGAGFGTVTLGTVGGSGPLTMSGPGILVLPNANTYTGGTTINGGRLIVTNTTGSGTGTGAVTVNSGGTLSGTGTIAGNIQVNAGGTIEPGSPMFPATAPGLLTANGNVTFAGGTFRAKLNGTSAGTGYDQLQVNGTLSLGAAVTQLATTLGFAPSAGNSLTIIQGGTVDAGRFVGLPDNTQFVVGTFAGTPYFATIHYTTNSVFLNSFAPVPEPVHLLLVGGIAGLAWRWRRRRPAL